MILLETPQHDAICHQSKLLESLGTSTLVAVSLDWVQQLLVEHGYMLHGIVVATRTAVIVVHGPLEARARTLLAEIGGKGFDIEDCYHVSLAITP